VPVRIADDGVERMRNDLAIALAISLALGAAAAWGSCALPHRGGYAQSITSPSDSPEETFP
jgi:hypothetical protein